MKRRQNFTEISSACNANCRFRYKKRKPACKSVTNISCNELKRLLTWFGCDGGSRGRRYRFRRTRRCKGLWERLVPKHAAARGRRRPLLQGRFTMPRRALDTIGVSLKCGVGALVPVVRLIFSAAVPQRNNSFFLCSRCHSFTKQRRRC